MAKLQRPGPDGFVPVVRENTFARESLGDDQERLVVSAAKDPAGLVRDLVLATWPPPYRLLYILIVSRTGQQPGRYELATPLDAAGLAAFVDAHGAYLSGDARHHLWVAADDWTIHVVYDRHDLLYVYGPADRIEGFLRERGFNEGPVAIPSPHAHEYHETFDDDERRLLSGHAWTVSPLADGDDD